MNQNQLFAACQNDNCLDVMDIHGSACDNAADTIGSRFVRGNFDEEFVSNWFRSLQCILSDGEGVSKKARAFFDGHNVAY